MPIPEFHLPDQDYDFKTNINATAQLFFENIREAIKSYEDKLDESKQLIWRVASLSGKEYRVTDVSYINPSLIRFNVLDDANVPCQLLVNVSSVQLIVQVVDMAKGEQKRRIGFQSPHEL